jgi:hypothetical protein
MGSAVPATLGLWWAVYIINGFVAMGIALSNLDLTTGKAAVSVGPANFITHALLGVAGALIIIVMRQLAQRQEAAAERLQSGAHADPGGPGAAVVDQASAYGPPQTSAPNPYT